MAQAEEITRQYIVGQASYVTALLIAFINGPASVVAIDLVMAFFAVTTALARNSKD